MVRLPLLMLVTPVRSMASVAPSPRLIVLLCTVNPSASTALTSWPLASVVIARSSVNEEPLLARSTVPEALGKLMVRATVGSSTPTVV